MTSRRGFLRRIGLVSVAAIVLPTDELIERLTHKPVFTGFGAGPSVSLMQEVYVAEIAKSVNRETLLLSRLKFGPAFHDGKLYGRPLIFPVSV